MNPSFALLLRANLFVLMMVLIATGIPSKVCADGGERFDSTGTYLPLKRYQQSRQWWWGTLRTGAQSLQADHLSKEHKASRSSQRSKFDATLADLAQWKPLGPSNSQGGYFGIGRVNCIVARPLDSNSYLVGTAGGGIWSTNNQGLSWTSRSAGLPVGSVTDIAFNPSNPAIAFAATGDFDGRFASYSLGVLKSSDSGKTWQATPLAQTAAQDFRISRLAHGTGTQPVVLAATNRGLWRSADQGVTWVQDLPTLSFVDLCAFPSQPGVFLAVDDQAKLHRTLNHGQTWSRVDWLLPAGTVRVTLSAATQPAGLAYALAISDNGGFNGLLRTLNEGLTWELVSNSPNVLHPSTDGTGNGGSGLYATALAVDPQNPAIVWVGGSNIWRSADSGRTWTKKTHYTEGTGLSAVHADHHSFAITSSGHTIFSANDGGVHRSTNAGGQWQWRGNGLLIMQFVRVAPSAIRQGVMLGGTLYNGAKLLDGGTWLDVLSTKDGAGVAIDATDDEVLLAASPFGFVFQSVNQGQSWSLVLNSTITQEPADYLSPVERDPMQSGTFYAGFRNVWKTTNRGVSWSPISNFSSGALVAIAISKSNPQVIYASNGVSGISVTRNGGVTWETHALPVGERLSSIEIDPADDQKIRITLSGFRAAAKVFESVNGGQSWRNLSANLPNVPANCLVAQPDSPGRLYVGTDVGVFVRDRSQAVWELFREGLPAVAVSDLKLSAGGTSLVAATLGAGMWQTDIIQLGSRLSLVNTENYRFQYQARPHELLIAGTALNFVQGANQAFDIALPFVFRYGGSTHNTLRITSNGYAQFSPVSAATASNRLDLRQPLLIVAPLWDSLIIGPQSIVSYSTDGTPPNRTFTVEWRNMRTSNAGLVTFGLHLRESNMAVAFTYQTDSAGQMSASVGLQGPSGGSFDFISIGGPQGAPSASSFLSTDTISGTWLAGVSGIELEFIPVGLEKPLLLVPVDQAIGRSTTPFLQWSSVARASGYHVQVSPDSTFSLRVLDDSTIVDTAVYATNLLGTTNYFWRVRAVGEGASPSGWSTVFRFTTVEPLPFVTLGSGTQTNTTFQFPCPYGNAFLGARHQFIARGDELVGLLPSNASIAALGFDVAQTNNVAPMQGLTIRMGNTSVSAFSTPTFVPALPTVKFAAPHSVSVGWNRHDFDSSLVWSGGSLVTDVCFNNDDFGSNPLVRFTETSGTQTTAMRFSDNDANCVSSAMQVSSQRPNQRFWYIGQVVLESPPSDVNDQPISFTATWRRVTGIAEYQVELLLRLNGSDSLVQRHTIGDTSITFSGLKSQRTYVWRIRATIDSRLGSWSTQRLYQTGTPPQITRYWPNPAKQGDTVRISGRFFRGIQGVRFGRVASTWIRVESDSLLLARVGAGNDGPLEVLSSFGDAQADTLFSFLSPPVIASFAPSSVKLGDTVRINGNFFSTTTRVEFGGRPARSFVIESPELIRAIVDSGLAGKVVVETAYGRDSSAGIVGYNPPPRIVDFFPDSGGLGTPVTIRGQHLLTANRVEWGNVGVSDFLTRTDTTLVVLVPEPVNNSPLRVVTSYGADHSDSVFRYLETTDLRVGIALQSLWNAGQHKITPVTIELRHGENLEESSLSVRSSAILGPGTEATVQFENLREDSYWIVVRHGSHLAIASRSPELIFSGRTNSYSFTASPESAAGFQTLELVDGLWVQRNGDADGNGDVNGLDYAPVRQSFGNSSLASIDSVFAPAGSTDGTSLELRVPLQLYGALGSHRSSAFLVELRSGDDFFSSEGVRSLHGLCDHDAWLRLNVAGLGGGLYWIVVRHPSHLTVVSSARVTIATGQTSYYDFSTSSGQALGFQSLVQEGGVWRLRAGDVNGNEDIEGQDFSVISRAFGTVSVVP